MVQQVHRALEGAEDLLADLLDISKLDQQAMVPDWVMTDVAALVEGLGEEFEAIAANAGLDFRIRKIPAMVKTDQRMLTRVLRIPTQQRLSIYSERSDFACAEIKA
ncbi:sensor histidine kinase [Marinobacter sp. 1-3A]|uniref:sensor histidine kinase n=1 Tax=Marinobacter sp. 1-3A TaxID=2582920 RepID=UPI001D0FBAEB|nr:hypothetical protein [Marinobacter sp. 1-3A]